MGSSCAGAVDPGMMLALGKLSHGDEEEEEEGKKACRCVARMRCEEAQRRHLLDTLSMQR